MGYWEGYSNGEFWGFPGKYNWVHCNMGLGDTKIAANGWYLFEVFDTRFVSYARASCGKGDYSTDIGTLTHISSH